MSATATIDAVAKLKEKDWVRSDEFTNDQLAAVLTLYYAGYARRRMVNGVINEYQLKPLLKTAEQIAMLLGQRAYQSSVVLVSRIDEFQPSEWRELFALLSSLHGMC